VKGFAVNSLNIEEFKMESTRRKFAHFCFFALLSVWANIAAAETLESYAQKCYAAIGVTVPDFNCDNGTEVPIAHNDPNAIYPDGNCDEPNRLNRACDPGSRFTVLTNSPSAYVVAHCRKKGYGPSQYGDIAVIQHNRTTGATCFYQSKVVERRFGEPPLDGHVKAPSKGTGAWPWNSPEQAAGIQCVHCHDNGPLIRSPYLAQLKTGPNALPGATDITFNSNQPYFFVGDDFAAWKVYKVEVDGNLCISCHRLGVSNLSQGLRGTAIDFAIRATGPSEEHKNPYSPDSPIWMPPHHVFFDQNNAL
jgi:hypothetical protein